MSPVHRAAEHPTQRGEVTVHRRRGAPLLEPIAPPLLDVPGTQLPELQRSEAGATRLQPGERLVARAAMGVSQGP